MIGRTVGAYRVLSKLGEGGMGAVFMGEHTLLGRRAAIKMLLPEMSARASVVNRFFNEARVVTSISDPGIVQVFDYGVHESGSAFIVMELLEGETISARLKRMRRIPAMEVLRLGRQIAMSLSAAHAKNVVHRDLKPDNIFIIGDPAVTGGERTKILDFGIAKLLQSDDEPSGHKTQTGILIGTPVYMSPEQCRGSGEVDHRSDIYSLGCVLFRMLAGRPPFAYPGSGELIASHLKEPPPLVSTFVADIAPELEGVVQQCLAKDPAQRPQTALELANLLGALEQGATFQTPVPGPAPPVLSAAHAYTLQLSPETQPLLTEGARPTTIQGASGQAASQLRGGASRKRSLGVIAAIAATMITAGVITIVTVTKGNAGDGASETVRPMASSPSPDPPPPAPAPEPTPSQPPDPPPAPAPIPTATAEPTAKTEPPATTAAPSKPTKPTTSATSRRPAKPKPMPKPMPVRTSEPKPMPVRTSEPKPKPGMIDRGD